MSFSFSILGSGSKGNSTLLLFETASRQRCALVDCGLSPRATNARLAPFGLGIDDVSDIVLTHLDWDHFHPGWIRRLQRSEIAVHVHERHRSAAMARGLDGRHLDAFDGPFSLGRGTRFRPIHLAHDVLGSFGFVIGHGKMRLGYASDLGRASDVLLEHFTKLHALALESNYDRQMQLTSGRPLFLKRRIMGGAGHLSNEESIDAVLAIEAQSVLAHVVPLHLSQQCNDPRLVKRLYAQRAPHLLGRLTISNQRHPTPLLRIEPAGAPTPHPAPRSGEQMTLL